MNPNLRNFALWVVIFLLVLALFNLFSGGQTTMASNARSYSDFVSAVESGTVAKATIDGEEVRYRGADNREYTTVLPPDAEVTNLLIERGVPVTASSRRSTNRADRRQKP